MLAGHEEGDHHVGDFVVGNGNVAFVGRVHQMPHHVLGAGLAASATLLDGVHVDLGDGALGVVAAVVPGERGPVKHEVDGGETHVEIVVEVGELLVKLVANFLALKRVRGGENGDLGHLGGNVDDAGLALEVGGPLEVAGNLIGDDGNVGAESLGGERNLHEL